MSPGLITSWSFSAGQGPASAGRSDPMAEGEHFCLRLPVNPPENREPLVLVFKQKGWEVRLIRYVPPVSGQLLRRIKRRSPARLKAAADRLTWYLRLDKRSADAHLSQGLFSSIYLPNEKKIYLKRN